MSKRVSVYLAAPLSQAKRMQDVAEHLRIAGYVIASNWQDTADNLIDPTDPSVRASIWIDNTADLNAADILFLDTTQGVPKCALVELGMALAQGKRVCWMQKADGSDTNVSDASALVRVVRAWSSVLPALSAFAQELGESPSATRLRMPSTPAAEASGAFKAANDILAGVRKAAR